VSEGESSVSSEIIPKENLVYMTKGSSWEHDSLGRALEGLLRYYSVEKIYTIDQLNQFVKDNVKVYKKDLTEFRLDTGRQQQPSQSCACFGCRLSRRVSGWFRGRK
jgi:hypothetical protein